MQKLKAFYLILGDESVTDSTPKTTIVETVFSFHYGNFFHR